MTKDQLQKCKSILAKYSFIKIKKGHRYIYRKTSKNTEKAITDIFEKIIFPEVAKALESQIIFGTTGTTPKGILNNLIKN